MENLNLIQDEIVGVLSKHLPLNQVDELRGILAAYFASKATEEFDRLAVERNWNAETYEDWLKERMRTPYQ